MEGDLVTVDHSVKEHLITTVEGNPKLKALECGLQVTSIFTRLRASAKIRRDRSQPQPGDNCHILYALKQKDGLVTTHTSVRLLVKSGRQILEHMSHQIGADTVIYMPSGYSLSRIIGQRCAKAFGAELVDKVFRKASKLEAYEALTHAEKNGLISTSEKRKLDFRLKKTPDVFSLKDIPVQHRHLFRPLHLISHARKDVQGHVVLVDDLLASGQTLSVAAELIREMEGVTSVQAVSLFSDL